MGDTIKTIRQKGLKVIYPAFMWLNKIFKRNLLHLSNHKAEPASSFYGLNDTLNNGSPFDFASLKGKKVLLVNTASNCGYTHQYDDLQKLYEQFSTVLEIIAFPANDFKEQEKGSDEEIAKFCRIGYGVTFPLMKKSSVLKGHEQNKVFQWLTDPAKNGWCKKQPSWNFSKYIVNENGMLTHYFGSSVSPLSKEFIEAIK